MARRAAGEEQLLAARRQLDRLSGREHPGIDRLREDTAGEAGDQGGSREDRGVSACDAPARGGSGPPRTSSRSPMDAGGGRSRAVYHRCEP
jgi:hypothetical protein